MDEREKIIGFLNNAIAAFEEGLSFFEGGNYSRFPEGKEEQIMAFCKRCSENMNAAQKLDRKYSTVYQHFSDGGNETGCRIAKNRWCFAKIDFARARVRDLEQGKHQCLVSSALSLAKNLS